MVDWITGYLAKFGCSLPKYPPIIRQESLRDIFMGIQATETTEHSILIDYGKQISKDIIHGLEN